MTALPPGFVEERFCRSCNDIMPHFIQEQEDGIWMAFCEFCDDISEEE